MKNKNNKYSYRPNRYWHRCKKCGAKNDEYYLKQTGPHYGLYCSKCDRWVKWVKQDEMLQLTGNRNINKVYDKNYKEIDVYTAQGLEKPKPLNEYVNVDTLTKEEYSKLNLPF